MTTTIVGRRSPTKRDDTAIVMDSRENNRGDALTIIHNGDGALMHNRLSESDSSAYSSSSVSSVESSRDRAHLTLDLKSMKPRTHRASENAAVAIPAVSTGTATAPSSTSSSADSTYSPPMSNVLQDPSSIVDAFSQALTPEQLLQFQQSWKAAILNGVQLSSPLQSNKTLAAQLQQQQLQQAQQSQPQHANQPLSKTDETPTPSTLIYPKHVTTPQQAFADGFQKVLSCVYRKHHFEPPSTPLHSTYTPSTVQYILSLLTPAASHQNQQQQSQDIISLFRQKQQPAALTSPTLPFFNAPSLPAANNASNPLVAAFPSANGLLTTSAPSNCVVTSATAVDKTGILQSELKRSADTTAAFAYKQLLLSPSAAKAGVGFDTTETVVEKNSAKKAAAAAVAAAVVAAAVNAVSPTSAEPPRKSPRRSDGSTPPDERRSIVNQSPSKVTADLFNGLCKLDPNNSRYMEFLHQQQQQHQFNSSNFSHNSSTSLPLSLNFSQNSAFIPTAHQQQSVEQQQQNLLATSQQQQHVYHHHSPIPQRALQLQQQQQQILPLVQQQQQQTLAPIRSVKQEADYHLSNSVMMPSTSSTLTPLETAVTTRKYAKTSTSRKSARNVRATYSGEMPNEYVNENNSFDEDQERKKLERKRARNRMAASKCRLRKLERITELEEQVETHKSENLLKQSQIQHLERQIAELNDLLERHRRAGCAISTPFKMSNI